MAGLQSLAKDTAIYGLSSIIGRFLNYLLVPLYTIKLPAESGGYGVVTNLYAYTALLLVVLTYGMETTFFRFANKENENPDTVYSTTLISIIATSLLFIAFCFGFLHPIANAMGYGEHPEFISMMAVIVGMDAIQSILFAYLRYKNRPIRFASLKLIFISCSIALNLFFLVVCPVIWQSNPQAISWFFHPGYSVGYIFISNLICTLLIMLLFLPQLLAGLRYRPDLRLLKRMLSYSFPILILGIAGILNQTVDKMIYPYLLKDEQEAWVQLGIYGAASKIAMILAMCTQAFRFAYEPFVFSKTKDKNSKETYANAMKYFIIFSLLAFLVVAFYLDILKYIIDPDYWAGLRVVPIVMGAEILTGIYFNLSFWYKLTDETRWGAYFSLIGCVIIILLNVIFVPRYGYIASAWAGFTGYAIITLISYLVGQRRYPVRYDLKKIVQYTLLAMGLYFISELLPASGLLYSLTFKTVLLFIYIYYLVKNDFPLKRIPFINRFIK